MSDTWKVVVEQLFLPLEQELAPLAAGASWPDENHKIVLSFLELKERTRCKEYPDGLNFDSASADNVRELLYKRVEIARDYRLWWTSDTGVGIKFTANALLGLKWREELELEFIHHKAGVTEQLWAIAERQLPPALRQVAKHFRKDAQARLLQIENTKQAHEHMFRELGPGPSKEG